MIKSLLFLSIILSSNFASAQLLSLEGFYRAQFYSLNEKLKTVIDPNSHTRSCETQITNAFADGVLKISLVLGYMDVSGNPESFTGDVRKYVLGTAADPNGAEAISDFLTRSCTGSRRNPSHLCGFRKSGSKFTKRIRSQKSARVEIELLHSARTTVDANNQNNQRQMRKSSQTESKFLAALKTKDMVIYMGHARNGGGPDFYPPVYSSGSNVDYGHYQRTQNGIKKMLGALSSTTNDAPIIGMLACKSTGLFAASIRRQAPSSILVTADTLFNYDEILPTGLAMVEALMQHQCGDSFTRSLRTGVTNPNQLNIFR
ncbi:MAG: hypothetical protein HRT45_15465 [Bdellovibrionales bacterium]|nr:hypothetical protein [Bdellovibrionales bacterium]